MDTLTQIVKSLKPGEVRLIRNFYKVQSNGEVKQRLALFDLVKNGKVKTDRDASTAIYKCEPNSAFSHLKTRLQQDVLNLLLLQDSSKRYDSGFARATFDVRRMLIEGQLLIGRGAYNAGVDILQKAGALSTKYELYNENIAINDLLRGHLGVKKGVKDYEKYDAVIKSSIVGLDNLLKAKDYYLRILVPNLFQLNRESQFTDFSKTAMVELAKMYKETGSANVGYHYYYIKVLHHQMHNEWTEARMFALDFLRLIEDEQSVYSSSRVAEANMQLANINLQTGFYDDAIHHSKSAADLYKKGLFNELQAIEWLFFSYYRNGDYKQAHATIKRAKEHPKYNANKLTPAKWDYYVANLFFAERKFKEAADMLIRYSELMKDRAGWLLGHKILELMCMIELGEIDIMDYRAESFRKLLQRQKDENIDRSKAILKVLETFIKTGSNFKKTREAEKKRLEQLKEGKDEYAWDPIGFELVRFDEWFEQRSKKK